MCDQADRVSQKTAISQRAKRYMSSNLSIGILQLQYLLRHSNCAAHTHSKRSVQSENKPLKSVAALFFQVSTADTTSVRLVSEMFPALMTGLLATMLL